MYLYSSKDGSTNTGDLITIIKDTDDINDDIKRIKTELEDRKISVDKIQLSNDNLAKEVTEIKKKYDTNISDPVHLNRPYACVDGRKNMEIQMKRINHLEADIADIKKKILDKKAEDEKNKGGCVLI